ncbi:transglycosylase SLT domain-containing protein [Streptomyces sp. NPDC002309]
MPKNTLRDRSRALTKTNKIALAGVTTLGAAALALSAVPSGGQTTTTAVATQANVAYSTEPVKGVKIGVTDGFSDTGAKVQAAAAKKAERQRVATAAASRSVERVALRTVAFQTVTPKKAYANNLDGWIREALSIMKAKGIPGSYHGLHKNIMRESSGNPNAINNWDINAKNGIPSKGLLQVIPPTFKTYHVPGTSWNIYDPVANITAAANYAADRYGSIDNVNSAY